MLRRRSNKSFTYKKLAGFQRIQQKIYIRKRARGGGFPPPHSPISLAAVTLPKGGGLAGGERRPALQELHHRLELAHRDRRGLRSLPLGGAELHHPILHPDRPPDDFGGGDHPRLDGLDAALNRFGEHADHRLEVVGRDVLCARALPEVGGETHDNIPIVAHLDTERVLDRRNRAHHVVAVENRMDILGHCNLTDSRTIGLLRYNRRPSGCIVRGCPPYTYNIPIEESRF